MLLMDTPVSIPNTKVKHLEADSTAWEAVWEGRLLPGQIWLLGQAVKTPPFHGGNRGSIPLGVTIWKHSSAGRASALQAEGHRFDPCCFHHKIWLSSSVG